MRRLREASPPVVLAGGMLGIALFFMVTTAIRMPVLVSLDETVYKLAAQQYVAGGLDKVIHDGVSRAVARLYALFLTPPVLAFGGESSVRVARAMGTVTFALAAVPVYLLARDALVSRGKAVAAALLSIAVPWATISTVLFSETLAYPLFFAALLAMTRQLRSPSPVGDAVVAALLVALILVRVQFLVLPVAWLLLVLVLGPPVRAIPRRFPALTAGVAVAALAVVALPLLQQSRDAFDLVTGSYVGGQTRVGPSVLKTALFELASVILGTGLVPFVLACAWVAAAVRGRVAPEARRVLVVAVVALAATWGAALAALGGWPGPDIAEERYFFQAAPLVLIAAFAALELPRLPGPLLAASAVVALVVLALSPITAGLSSERAFLVPVAATMTNLAQRVDPPAAADLAALAHTRTILMLAIALVVLAAAAAVRRLGVAVLVPAVVLQLAFTGYAVATMHGQVPGVRGATDGPSFAAQAFVDGAVPGDTIATILSDGVASRAGRDLETALFNDRLAMTTRFPGITPSEPSFPVNGLASEEIAVDGDLQLTPLPKSRYALAWRDSPFVQLAGRPVAGRPDRGDVLLALDEPLRATWVARGLGPEAQMSGPLRVTAAPARWRLSIEAPPAPASRVQIAVGGPGRTARLQPGMSPVILDLCGERGAASATLTPRGAVPSLRAATPEPC